MKRTRNILSVTSIVVAFVIMTFSIVAILFHTGVVAVDGLLKSVLETNTNSELAIVYSALQVLLALIVIRVALSLLERNNNIFVKNAPSPMLTRETTLSEANEKEDGEVHSVEVVEEAHPSTRHANERKVYVVRFLNTRGHAELTVVTSRKTLKRWEDEGRLLDKYPMYIPRIRKGVRK